MKTRLLKYILVGVLILIVGAAGFLYYELSTGYIDSLSAFSPGMSSPLAVEEYKDPYDFDILTLKGMHLDSFTGYYKIQLNQEGDEINILAYRRALIRPLRADLDYSLVIPKDISMVTFGKNRDKIWSREGGVVKSPYIGRWAPNWTPPSGAVPPFISPQTAR